MPPNFDDCVVGQAIQILAEFKLYTLIPLIPVLADPTALRLKLRNPSGVVTTYIFGVAPEVVKDAVGKYHANIVMNVAGNWSYRWESDAPNAGADEGRITVKKSIVI